MNKKLIIAAGLIVAISALTACNYTNPKNETPTDITEAATVITTAEETTLAITTLEATTLPPTTTELTTEPTTAKPTTTKAATTKPSTTVPETLPVTTVLETKVQSDLPTISPIVRSNETVEETKLKYGVIMHTYEKIYYQYLTDGSRHIVDEKTSYTYDRSYYRADYEDLLPGAKENREEYRDYINKVLKIINSYRAEGGVAPLTLNEEFTIMSCVRAEEIGWSGKFSHIRPNYTTGPDIFKEIGYKKGTAGENLGRGFPTPEAICAAWKESDVHYEVLMDPDFTETGIGVSAGPGPDCGGLFWTQHFYGAPK